MTTQGGSYSWNAVCDVCGFQYKAKELRKRWDGLMVCAADFETRHPLDFYKVRSDYHQLPFIRPDDTRPTGSLPVTFPTTVPTAQPDSGAVGTLFTVGATGRKLIGIRLGGVYTFDTRYHYIKTLPITVKLWDAAGNLLTSWVVRELDYKFVDADTYSEATAQLLPAYILSASTDYTISARILGTNGVASTTLVTSVQPFITYTKGMYSLADTFPNTPMADAKASPYFDIITGSID